jgi:hypothetical protein
MRAPHAMVLPVAIAAASCAAPPSGAGRVVVSELAFGTSPLSLDVTVEFGSFPAPADRCTHTPVGACTLIECPGEAWHLFEGELPRREPPRVAAGALTFEVDGDVIALEGAYVLPNDLREGQRITVAAAGDVVPPFAISLAAPGVPIIDVPALVDRSRDLVITWTPSLASATSRFDLTYTPLQIFGSPPYSEVECTAPGDAGVLTIPREALAMLTPSADGLVIVATHEVSTSVEAGGFEIEMSIVQTSYSERVPTR